MAMVTLDNVTKEFGSGGTQIIAVEDISLDISDGEFLVLVGPSGCGKSTTLRMIAGLESITDGEISINGERINDKPPQERDIAMVFQSYALYPHMTVRGNMRFGLEESTDLPDDEINEHVEQVATKLEIEPLLDRKPDELSGGQQQRVALGRAIVRDPDVFLMDEPLSNLDAKLRAQMRTELQRLQDDLDVTTVYVTHDQTEAMTMGDRIAILNEGRLQQVGTPLECYHAPANLFVAGFIGEPTMNFFAVDFDGTSLIGTGFEYELSKQAVDAVSGVTELVLGVRPTALQLVMDSADGTTLEADVDVVESLGDEKAVHLRTIGGDTAETFVVMVDGMRRIEKGDRVTVRIPEDSIHIFDRTTEQALVVPTKYENSMEGVAESGETPL